MCLEWERRVRKARTEYSRMSTLLIVDDDDAVRALLYDALSDKYECHTASMAEEALQYLEVETYDAILTDIAMPGLDGIELLKRVQMRDLPTPVIVISGKGNEEVGEKLVSAGAFAYLNKPFSIDEIERVVRRAVEK